MASPETIFEPVIKLNGRPELIKEPFNRPPREAALPTTPDGMKELGYYVAQSSEAGGADAPMVCGLLTFKDGQEVRLPLYMFPPESAADQSIIRSLAKNIGLKMSPPGQAVLPQMAN